MLYRFIDIETYSDLDIRNVGRKSYMEHSSFMINMVGWIDIELNNLEDIKNININDLNFESLDQLNNPDMKKAMTEKLLNGFKDKRIIHVAHNALFEIEAFSRLLDIEMDLSRWICTMVWCYQTGLPGKLETVCKVLNLKNAKLAGINLIKYFAKPCKPTKINGGRTRNYPKDDTLKWEEYKYYNKYDVLSMIELVQFVLVSFPQTEFEKNLWKIDHEINKNGISLDTELVRQALHYTQIFNEEIRRKLKEGTALDNPNSNIQFKGWLQGKMPGVFIESIDKAHLATYYGMTQDIVVKDIIELKRGSSKTSLKKYDKLRDIMFNGKVFDILQFTATGTGRWAGRGFQIHNLPKNKLGKDLDIIRSAYKNNDRPITKELPFELSQLLRTVLIPDENKLFMVADYSAIEARVAAWVAGEEWVLKAFEKGRDIYIETASKMFDINYDKVTKEDRQDGKVAVLACGYGGGQLAIANFAPDWSEEKRQVIVDYYRNANKNIVATWRKLEKAVVHTVKNKVKTRVGQIIISIKKGCLLIKLPSGRSLTYVRIKESTKSGALTISNLTYEEMSGHAWGISKTYGGKLFENIVQAIARDILAYAIVNLYNKGYDIKFHIHDEIIVQVLNTSANEDALNAFCKDMSELPKWAEGLPMKAEGFITPYYKKEE